MRPIRVCLLLVLLTPSGTHSGDKPAQPVMFHGKTLVQWSQDLDSPDVRTRRRAVGALGLSPFGRQAVPPLLKAQRDRERIVSRAALMMLADLGPDAPEAGPLLAEDVRIDAIIDLEKIGASKIGLAGIPPLIARIRKADIGAALGALDGAERSAIPLLRGALKDESVTVRVATAYALGNMGKDAAAALPELLAALSSPDENERYFSLGALKQIGPVPSMLGLLSQLLRERSDMGPTTAVLAQLGNPGMATISQAYHAGDVANRACILENISSAGRGAFPLYADGLRHPLKNVREAAARGLRKVSVPLDAILPDLIESMNHPDDVTRREIVDTLRQIVPPRRQTLLALTKALCDESPHVSSFAGCSLAEFGHCARGIAPQLVGLLQHSRDHVREEAAKVLGRVGLTQREIVFALCLALKDPAPAVRLEAAEALGNLGRDVRVEAIPVLSECLADPRFEVRLAASVALVQLGERTKRLAIKLGLLVLDLPCLLMGKSREDQLREKAAQALARMGKDALPALPLLFPAMLERHQRSRVSLESKEIAVEAMAAVQAMGPLASGAVPALRHILITSDREYASAAAGALVHLGKEGTGALRELLSRGDRTLTWKVLCGLGEAGAEVKGLLPEIIREARNPDDGIWRDGIWDNDALIAIKAARPRSKEALSFWIGVLDGDNAYQCRIACQALGEMGPFAREASRKLLGFLVEPDAIIRLAAVEALGRIGPDDRAVLSALIGMLADRNEGVKCASAEALGGAGEAALLALRDATRDTCERLRVAAARSLARCGKSREAILVLRGVMLDGKNALVRVEAALAHWHIHLSREVVPVLAELLRDEVARSAAEAALVKLDEVKGDVRAFMRPLLHHEEREVRAAAWRILDKIAPDLTAEIASR